MEKSNIYFLVRDGAKQIERVWIEVGDKIQNQKLVHATVYSCLGSFFEADAGR